MKIRLNCLGCGFPMALGESYENYQGEIRCWGCQAVLEVTLQEGNLLAMKRSNGSPAVIVIETTR